MRARVPMDVDLEDRLLFGLPPLRLGYVAIAAVVALAVWRGVPFVGGPLAVLATAVGAAFGWGSWRGRGPDHWAVSAALWALRTRRVEFVGSVRLRTVRVRRPAAGRGPLLRPRPPATIHVLTVVRDPDAEP